MIEKVQKGEEERKKSLCNFIFYLSTYLSVGLTLLSQFQ